jgi:hypothetical protein
MEDPFSLEVHALPGKLTHPSEVLEILDEERLGVCVRRRAEDRASSTQ